MTRGIGLTAVALAAIGGAWIGAGSGEGGRRLRRHIDLPGRVIVAPFSDGVLVGDTLYLAGRIGLDPSTGKPPADPEAEARLALDGVKAVLAEAGMTMDDLVSVAGLLHRPVAVRDVEPGLPRPTSARTCRRARSSAPGRCCVAGASRCRRVAVRR